MLSLTRVNSGQASSYYTADDYYLQNVGEWQGGLADKLEYTGEIKEADFQSLIKGVDPQGRFEIQSGGKDHVHTAGVDLTFSAPKSVSIAGLVLDDKRVLEAHHKAVSEALRYIEKNYTNVRIKEDGKVHSEHTGNMLAAKFQHISSRELDPQIHTHCLVLNFTEKTNGDIKAMDYKEIYDAKLLLGQIYRSELAANLKEHGYQIESDSKGLFEIKGVPSELMAEFSKRSEQIQQRFDELKEQFPSRNEAELKAQAALETRKVKDEPSPDELKQQWNERTSNLQIDKQSLTTELTTNATPEKTTTNINIIIDRAVSIATEHEAVASREDILKVATKISMGEHRVNALQEALDNNQSVIKLNAKEYTTIEIVEMENKIVNQVIDGREKLNSMDQSKVQDGIKGYENAKGFSLTDGQKQSVEHIMSSTDRIIAIQGDAGTGKTTMLDVVRTIVDKENSNSENKVEVVGLSFTGKAASEIEDASQIQSRTIASLVGSKDELHGKLVVIDEASMLSIKDINSILNRSDETTKIVLIGDTKQLQTIGQGKIFSSLQEKDVISTVRMSEVQRQKNLGYKDVVDKLGNKQIEAAFEKLNASNRINEISQRSERLSAITAKYLENPKETIIVTAANKDGVELNKMIRDELKQAGKVSHQGIDYVTRETKSLLGAEKFYAENYSAGDIVVANKADVLGKAGAEAKITSINKEQNTITVQSMADKKELTLDLKIHGGNLQIYTEQNKTFAAGDKILFLKNDKGLGVKNGQTGTISEIGRGNKLTVKTEKGTELQFNPSTQYKYIGHGYALTDYKSQGQTEKHVIYHADTDKGVNFNQAYVGITRGKDSVTIYTNDKDSLMEKVKQEQQKTTTLDHNLSNASSANQARLNDIVANTPTIKTPDAEMLKAAAVAPASEKTADKSTKEISSQDTKTKSQGIER